MEIFPEAVANSIFKFCIHPVAELYISEKRREMLSEPLRPLNIYKERLRLLDNKDNRLGLSRDIVNNPEIPDYKKQELILEYTEHFLGHIDHYEGVISRGLAIRQFYRDSSDEEDEYTDFIQNYI
jgi:hypothetical protein